MLEILTSSQTPLSNWQRLEATCHCISAQMMRHLKFLILIGLGQQRRVTLIRQRESLSNYHAIPDGCQRGCDTEEVSVVQCAAC
ncbi:hypothetical protein V2G26_013502 [Clonostachys chloroleuca]